MAVIKSKGGEIISGKLVSQTSLAKTLVNVEQALFFGSVISRADRVAAANWIVSRHNLPRSYQGTFAPTDQDYSRPALLFTGEKLTSGAQTGHILGQEAMRALRLLGHYTKPIQAALDGASGQLWSWIDGSSDMPEKFCCSTCTVALWRNLLAGSFCNHELIFEAGVNRLQRRRDGKGRWKSYPFWYTLLALSEMPLDVVQSELTYCLAICEGVTKRRTTGRAVDRRRRSLAKRVVTLCS